MKIDSKHIIVKTLLNNEHHDVLGIVEISKNDICYHLKFNPKNSGNNKHSSNFYIMESNEAYEILDDSWDWIRFDKNDSELKSAVEFLFCSILCTNEKNGSYATIAEIMEEKMFFDFIKQNREKAISEQEKAYGGNFIQ